MNRPIPGIDGVPIHAWNAAPLDGDVRTALERLANAPDVRHLAVMSDVHRELRPRLSHKAV